MKRELNLWVVGGDHRQARLAELLQEDGHTVTVYGLEEAEAKNVRQGESLAGAGDADCVILPVPLCSGDGLLNAPCTRQRLTLAQTLDALYPDQIVCAGRVTPQAAALAEERGLILRDYLDREEMAVANAVPTAEGAIQIAMEELPATLQGSRVLVVGFGRLGKALAPRLRGLGARVTVSARRYEDLAWIETLGCCSERTDQLEGWLCSYDLVINTVPAKIFTEALLRDLSPGCLLIDLASRPGGVDFDAAQRLGIKTVHALSLPGKVAPVSAARILRNTIYHLLQELRI